MRLIDAAADLLLGGRCPGCGCPGWSLCDQCHTELASFAPRLVALRSAGAHVMAAGPYTDITARIVSSYKEYGRWNLSGVLGARLAVAVAALVGSDAVPLDRWWLVPMPSRTAATRRRGSDVTARLARSCARVLRTQWGADVGVWTGLRLSGSVVDQAGLDRRAREDNVRGGLLLRGRPPGACVLVDDITTTGTTLREAHRVLTDAGTRVLGAGVVAKVMSD